MKTEQRLKRYKYHVIWHGAPYGDNEFGEIDYSSNDREKCERFIQNDSERAFNSKIMSSEEIEEVCEQWKQYMNIFNGVA